MIKVGITGGIGSGKSTVCRVLSMLSVPVYYSDPEARRLMETDPGLTARIRELFGDEAYTSGKLNSGHISDIVFNNQTRLAELNAAVHPAVARDFERWAAERSAPYVIEESAILFESGAADRMDYTVAVTAPEALRIERVVRRDGVPAETVRRRIASQMPESERIARADFVLVSDEEHMLIPQVMELHEKLCSL